jgi:hypothetical protein
VPRLGVFAMKGLLLLLLLFLPLLLLRPSPRPTRCGGRRGARTRRPSGSRCSASPHATPASRKASSSSSPSRRPSPPRLLASTSAGMPIDYMNIPRQVWGLASRPYGSGSVEALWLRSWHVGLRALWLRSWHVGLRALWLRAQGVVLMVQGLGLRV